MTLPPPPEVPDVIKDSAMVFAVILHELGFSGKTTSVLARGKQILDVAMTTNTSDAIGDDLDAYSVAVGFTAAMGIFASCSGRTPRNIDYQELTRQMRKAKDN